VRRGRGQRRGRRSTAAKERGRCAGGRRRHGGPWGINGAVRRGVRRSGDGAYWRGCGGIVSSSPAAAGTGRLRQRVLRVPRAAARLVAREGVRGRHRTSRRRVHRGAHGRAHGDVAMPPVSHRTSWARGGGVLVVHHSIHGAYVRAQGTKGRLWGKVAGARVERIERE
jgi:hypothetical protein